MQVHSVCNFDTFENKLFTPCIVIRVRIRHLNPLTSRRGNQLELEWRGGFFSGTPPGSILHACLFSRQESLGVSGKLMLPYGPCHSSPPPPLTPPHPRWFTFIYYFFVPNCWIRLTTSLILNLSPIRTNQTQLLFTLSWKCSCGIWLLPYSIVYIFHYLFTYFLLERTIRSIKGNGLTDDYWQLWGKRALLCPCLLAVDALSLQEGLQVWLKCNKG